MDPTRGAGKHYWVEKWERTSSSQYSGSVHPKEKKEKKVRPPLLKEHADLTNLFKQSIVDTFVRDKGKDDYIVKKLEQILVGVITEDAQLLEKYKLFRETFEDPKDRYHKINPSPHGVIRQDPAFANEVANYLVNKFDTGNVELNNWFNKYGVELALERAKAGDLSLLRSYLEKQGTVDQIMMIWVFYDNNDLDFIEKLPEIQFVSKDHFDLVKYMAQLKSGKSGKELFSQAMQKDNLILVSWALREKGVSWPTEEEGRVAGPSVAKWLRKNKPSEEKIQ